MSRKPDPIRFRVYIYRCLRLCIVYLNKKTFEISPLNVIKTYKLLMFLVSFFFFLFFLNFLNEMFLISFVQGFRVKP